MSIAQGGDSPFFFFAPSGERAASPLPRVVRVGWFEQHGVFMEQKGQVYGYAPSLLEGIAQYTHWRFEWVPILFEELEAKLASGEIDISCGISWTPQRARNMTYSRLYAGVEITTLHVRPDSNFHYMDFHDLDGKTFGFFAGAYEQSVFRRLAKQYGFRFSMKEFEQSAAMLQALKDGQVDGYVDGCPAGDAQTMLAGTFSIEPFFFVSARGDTVFMPQINEAMRQLQMRNPQFMTSLFNSFLNVDNEVTMALSRDEEAWLKGQPVLRMAYSVRQKLMRKHLGNPFLYRMASTLAQRAGIRLEFVPAASYEDALALLESGKADMISDIFPGMDAVQTYGIRVGHPFYNAPISLAVKRHVSPGTGLRIAATREMVGVSEAYKQTYPADHFIFFESLEQCHDALKDGSVDGYVADYPGVSIESSQLSPFIMQITQAFYPMAFGFARQVSPHAITVLNKRIMSLSGGEVETMVAEYVAASWMVIFLDHVRRNIHWYGLALVLLGGLLLHVRHRREMQHLHELERAAYTDDVTGGSNRRGFLQQAEEALKQKGPWYVISINIRRLAQINRSLGYNSGTETIRDCYRILCSLSASEEPTAHVGGGHYLCLWRCDGRAAVEQRMQELFRRCSARERALEHALVLSCGIAPVVEGDSVASLMGCAETARNSMAAQDYHSGFVFFDAEMGAIVARVAALENRMQAALDAGEFQVLAQPQIHLASGKVCGAEALVRWLPADGTKIYPDEFIPLFERNGFIRELDMYVLEQVCRWIRRRLDGGLPVVPVAVNQSRSLFLMESYSEHVRALLRQYAIPQQFLAVEITESLAALDEELVIGNLRRLREFGVKTAMDDFGTGYSSLAVLQKFPIDTIKLDRAFLADKKNAPLVRSLVHLGHDMHLTVLCEGVETEQEWHFLLETGCDLGQGYLFGRPMPLSSFEAYLEEKPLL